MSEEAEEETTDDFGSILEQVRTVVRAESEPEDESEEFSEGPSFEEEEEQEVDTQEESEDDYEDSDTTEDEGELDTEESPDAQEEEVEEEPGSELDQIRQELVEERERNRQWQEAFRRSQEQPKKQGLPDIKASPQHSPNQDQLEEAFRLQLFGTPSDKESYDSLPAGIKTKAQEAFKRHSHEETLNTLYPERRYTQQIRYFVKQDIERALGGLTQDFHARKAKEVFSRYEDQVRSPEDRKRLLEVMSNIPGSDSNDWRTQERVLDLAVQQVLREREEGDLTSRERDVELRERQIKQGRGTRSSTKGKRGRRRSRSQEKKMESGDDMLEFARSLEKEIRNGR